MLQEGEQTYRARMVFVSQVFSAGVVCVSALVSCWPTGMMPSAKACILQGGRVSIAGAYAGYCNHYNLVSAELPACLPASQPASLPACLPALLLLGCICWGFGPSDACRQCCCCRSAAATVSSSFPTVHFLAAPCPLPTAALLQGAFMEECLTMRAGQTPVQKYWHKLLAMIQVS